MEFKDKIRRVRETLFISQEILAKELGVSFATINRLEKGHTKPSILTKARFDSLCKTSGITFNGGDE